MPQQATLDLPASITRLTGRIIDADQHECTPINLWADEFGTVTKPIVDAFGKMSVQMAQKTKDDTEISADTIWTSKLENAPGAFDLSRRLEVMDFIGVDRTLLFPGTLAMISISLANEHLQQGFLRDLDVQDRSEYGRKLQRAYNDWCLRTSRFSDRLRAVAILVGDSPEDMYAEAKRLVSGGVRAVWIPSGIPQAGLSPADPAHDPLWALLADADCPVLDHSGGQSGFMATDVWRSAPAFQGWGLGEFSLDPWMLSTAHFAAQNYLTVLVLGGVFERHPKLRYGTAELRGDWVAPAAETMELWLANKPFRNTAGERVLSMKPSDYIRRNVRIACYDFEPIDQYIKRYGFEEVYCYGSDYPHYAGGNNPLGSATRNVESLGPSVLQQFFVDNGRLLLPN